MLRETACEVETDASVGACDKDATAGEIKKVLVHCGGGEILRI